MACQYLRFKDGGVAIVCSRGERREGPPCACGAPSTRLCDFPMSPKRSAPTSEQLTMFVESVRPHSRKPAESRTCDAPLCDACAKPWSPQLKVQPLEAGVLHRDEFDLCPRHHAEAQCEKKGTR